MNDTTNHRIDKVLAMMKSLSEAQTPDEVIAVFSEDWIEFSDRKIGYISLSCRGLEEGQYRVTRALQVGDVAATHTLPDWQDSSGMTVHDGGILGRIIEHVGISHLKNLDLADDPVLGMRFSDYQSMLAIPLFDRGRINNWAIVISQDNDAFDDDDVEDRLLKSNLIGGTVRQVIMMQQLRDAKREIDNEMKRIAAIQAALLPKEMPDIPGIRLAARYETYDKAGGDMYFFREAPDGRLGMLVGDVSGHGPAAAVVMAMVESMISGYSGEFENTSAVMKFINDQLYQKQIQHTFVTAFCCVYDPKDMTLRYSRAGHPPPMLRSIGEPLAYCFVEDGIEIGGENLILYAVNRNQREDGEAIIVEHLDHAGGLPLGLFKDQHYEEVVIRMRKGQTLVMYTDGITETRAPDGAFFGTQGVEAALHDCSGEVACAVKTIMARVREHEAGQRPADDQTLLVMQIDP
ncbi:PP2C family protein-serine/threonine phosphatase [Poriferisphaera sp. WC338]|uniref:PP2C family protein-serine/threonine phosphatase n=1 Tax=Poriferisphaera sp. WC338 TaxID=3425129 RepID=UPI003D81C26F